MLKYMLPALFWVPYFSAAADLPVALRLPVGFTATVYSDEVPNARVMVRGEKGTVFDGLAYSDRFAIIAEPSQLRIREHPMYRKLLQILCMLTATLALQLNLAACNTIQGAGKDIKSAGGAIEKKAEEKKSY